ncbi:MAG TPA: cytochrome C oxidase subunit IV family protein [Terriglobales bacterium]|nr:cytochrome C oxidase subunit IV family protein [Terriglobales bacterium]
MSSHRELTMGSYVGIGVGLMAIVGLEVIFTYQHLPPRTLLFALLCLACLEAYVAIMYLMHVKYERPILYWTIFPATLFVLLFLCYLFPDAFRMFNMRLMK